MFLQRNPDMEAAPHFVYLIRHNPLNPRISFLLSPSYNELSSRLHTMLPDLQEVPDVSGWSPFYRSSPPLKTGICRSMDCGLLR
ncbi:hypothetical protein LNP17_20585 [Klebsiella variicola subsp. variicola]|nr:hypothetical protein [Klebsiella variicola subsp. variicola]